MVSTYMYMGLLSLSLCFLALIIHSRSFLEEKNYNFINTKVTYIHEFLGKIPRKKL